jgi:hypothetical protein
VLVILLLAAALVLGLGALWLSRVSTLTRRVGSFTCQLAEHEAGPWRAGTAQYGHVRMFWWRRASLAPRAAAVWQRHRLDILERHGLPEVRPAGQRPVAVVVHCRLTAAGGRGEVWLRMSPDAYAGFTSWIEAAPTAVRSVI